MNKKLSIALIVVGLAILGVGVINTTRAQDWLRGMNYEPSVEMSAIMSGVSWTDDAMRILRATQPVVLSSEEFNQHCRNARQDMAILGCYTGGNIYVYGIESAELEGIKESTLAHELLHAAWARMSDEERARIGGMLEAVYNSNTDLLAGEVGEIYASDERVDELHSRVGVQIANLPDELEAHYAKYFGDQDAVVKYYAKYNGVFKKLRSELDGLETEMANLKAQIDSDTAAYEAVQQTSDVAEMWRLYNKLNGEINEYNQKVEQYNKNVLKTQDLNAAINSNKTPTA